MSKLYLGFVIITTIFFGGLVFSVHESVRECATGDAVLARPVVLYALDVSADWTMAAVGTDVGIWFYDAKDLSVVCALTIDEPDETVYEVQWSPDGRWLAAGYEGNKVAIRVWESETGYITAVVPADTSEQDDAGVLDIAWSPNGDAFAFVDPTTLKVFSLTSNDYLTLRRIR